MQKIVAILNDFEKADLVLGRAVALASDQNAVLEIIYVYEAPLFTIPDFFLPPEEQKENIADKEKIKAEVEERVAKLGYDQAYAVFVYIDDTADRVSAHARDEENALVISAYHKNVSEDMVKICHLPLLILKDDDRSYNKIDLPVEMNEGTGSCIDMAENLFRQSSITLIYDHHYLVDRETKQAQINAFEALKAERHMEGVYIEEFAWNEADFGEDYDTIEMHLIEQIKKGEFDLTLLCARHNDLLSNEALIISLMHRLSTDFLVYRQKA